MLIIPSRTNLQTLTLTGQILASDGTVGAPGYSFSADTDTGFYRTTGAVLVAIDGVQRFRFGSDHTLIFSTDTVLVRDAASRLALRNSTTAQRMSIYNTFTTLNTSGEWLDIDWATTANTCLIRTNAGSSAGTVRAMVIQPATQPTTAVNGAAVSIITGAPVSGTANGGALVLSTASGTSSGTAGAITITTGASNGASNGPALTLTATGGATTAGATGGNAGTFLMTGVAGGASTNASGTGGIGSIITFTGGAGGTASGTTSSIGGLGGGLTFTAGNGGTITGTTTAIGGAGGAIAITAGNGATATTGSANTAGAGGNLTFTAGNAGAAGGNVAAGIITFTPGTATGTGAPGYSEFTRGAVVMTGSVNNRITNNRVLYGATTDAATAVELTSDGAAGSGALNRIKVPTDTAMSFVLNIVVKQSASANAKQMLRQFVLSNNGGTTAVQGSVTTLGTDVGSAGLTTVTCTITANDTDDCVKVEVNGVVGTALKFTAFLVSAEILYA